MEQQVTIERSYIPMRQAFSQDTVRAFLCRREIPFDRPDVRRLIHSGRTFAQYCCLAGDDRLLEPLLSALGEALDEADRLEPLLLVEQYPWLKSPAWTLSMRDVSHYKIAVDCGDGRHMNVERIQCEPARDVQDSGFREMDQIGAVLSLHMEKNGIYPALEGPACTGRAGGISAAPVSLRLLIAGTPALHNLVKELLLHGTIDLKRYTLL